MNPAAAIVVFVIVWWVIFFAVLPWGVKGRWESKDDGVKGAEPGAPVDPDLKRKLLWTTAIAVPVWAVVEAVILLGVLDFRS